MCAAAELADGWQASVAEKNEQLRELDAALPAAKTAERDSHTALLQAEAQLAYAQNLLSAHLKAEAEEHVPGEVCPVCRQRVNEEHKAKLHAEHKDKEKELSDEVWRWHEESSKLRGVHEECQRHLASLEEHREAAEKSLQVCSLPMPFCEGPGLLLFLPPGLGSFTGLSGIFL
jgi:DNA repair exonuclease SbcCD ATPase subunit